MVEHKMVRMPANFIKQLRIQLQKYAW